MSWYVCNNRTISVRILKITKLLWAPQSTGSRNP